jgi:4-alpha-glucanotransferase
MLFDHSSAILLHPTSLPGPYGIGDLGPNAYRWLDWQASTGTRWWQMLPLGPTGYADSPYASFSSFAGNPMLISPDLLVQQGLLAEADVAEHPDFPDHKVDFGAANGWKENLLSRAFEAAGADPGLQADFAAFRQQERGWLEDYALFMALKDQHDMRPWWQWDEALRNRQQSALKAFGAEHQARIDRHAFLQFIFFQQWAALRQRMAELDIRVIGDVPIYVARDSVDLWANPHLFELDAERNPTAVAGVPPDYFSEQGQLWGNPLYAWGAHAEEGYAWWFARLRAVLRLADVVRLDHFRGFYDYWAVPAGAEDAVNGEWRKGPADDFFNAVRAEFGELPLIAEDLGEINPEVFKLRDRFSLPGMKILQFAFDADMDDDFLPHNYPENCVAYSGTHDNDTTVGWYAKASPKERTFCNEYLGTDGKHIAWRFIEALWTSRADLVVAPMQDFLELGSHARMNIPSTIGGNWTWRLRAEDLSGDLAERIATLNEQNTR